MKKVKRKRAPIFDRTYRVEPGPVNYWKEADRLRGQRVVVYMPASRKWKRGYLMGLIPSWDIFLIKWKKSSEGRRLSGIWRVHTPSLFTEPPLLPVPLEPARVPATNTQQPQGGQMATRTKATTKKSSAKKPAADDNGGTTRTRRDKLEGLSDAKKRNIAKLIYRERSKSPATSWGDITEMIQEKYDWTLPGSMTGRRLLRDHGPDGAEDAIIKQDRTNSKKKDSAKAKATTTKRKKKVVEVEDEDDEDEDDDELEDDEDMEVDEDEDEDEDDEDDEDDEEDEPPAKAKKVRVTRGRGRKPNPSK